MSELRLGTKLSRLPLEKEKERKKGKKLIQTRLNTRMRISLCNESIISVKVQRFIPAATIRTI